MSERLSFADHERFEKAKVVPLFPRPFCCLCFRMDQAWSVDEHGQKWDVCIECKTAEDAYGEMLLADEHRHKAKVFG